MAGETRAVLMTAGIVTGGLYVAGEMFGGGECFEAVVPWIETDQSVVTACIGDEENSDAYVTGPDIKAARIVDTQLVMQFGAVEAEVVYPKINGNGTKLDYDPAFWENGNLDFDGAVDTTLHVMQDPIAVHFTPCVPLGEDYRDNNILLTPVDNPASAEVDTNSYLDISFEYDDSTTELSSVNVSAPGIEACNTHIPTVDSDGNNNVIPYEVGDGAQIEIPAPQRNTFDLVLRNLAMYEVMAADCVGALVDSQAALDNIKTYVVGSLVEQGIVIDPAIVEVEFTEQEVINDDYRTAYAGLVREYRNLERTLPGTGGDNKIEIIFGDTINEVTDCSTVAEIDQED